jgi:MSHA pilin protein MshB
MKRSNKQKGFTIIELVVVILLLGILTATALPRFIDVTDEAHNAVVDSVIGGLSTGSALFRAQWYAENQPNTVGPDFDMVSFRTGYPMGGELGNLPSSMATSGDCADLFRSLLQDGGRPSITSVAADTGLPDSILSTTGDDADFIAYLDDTSSITKRSCYFAYTGQFTNNTGNALPLIVYSAATGAVTLSSIGAD